MKDRETLLELRDRALTEFSKIAIEYKNNNTITQEMVVSNTNSTIAIISVIDFCLDDTGKDIDIILEETTNFLNYFIKSDGKIPVVEEIEESQIKEVEESIPNRDKIGLLTKLKQIKKVIFS